jgi:predicted O-linked N-acetylglucosamine transferase (SPINDLY family)
MSQKSTGERCHHRWRCLRRRVQTFVDRRFDRERYDAEQVVAGFSGRLQTAVDLELVTDELGSAVAATLRPARVAVRFAASPGRQEAR